MCFLPFICAGVAGFCTETATGSSAAGWAVFAALCSVTFAIAHGASCVAESIDEIM